MQKVKIAGASIDERGHATGGKAGDQTGREVKIQDYYMHKKGWRVFRPILPEIAQRLAYDAKAAANNKNIGYDQSQRNTLYAYAKNVGFDCSKVTTPCETDCSALVRVCLAYAGITVPASFRTSNEPSYLINTGDFIELKDPAYTKGCAYLKAGDILVTPTQGHTVIVITDGQYSHIEPTNEKKWIEVTAKSVYVRTAPNTAGKILGVVYRGDRLPYGGKDDSVTNWHLVEFKNKNGWITPKYTKLV